VKKTLPFIIVLCIVLGVGIFWSVTKDSVPSGILPFDSGVQGYVFLGPICPVLRDPLDVQCADKPYVTMVRVFTLNSDRLFATIATNKEGFYVSMLPPGDYNIQAVGGNPFPSCSIQSITIQPGVMQNLDLSCDTGIR